MRHFTQAIVRPPGPSYVDALTSVDLGKPDLERALTQHAAYVETLKSCGLKIYSLPPDDHPDSVFVEDGALCLENFAVVTRPGAESRRAETESIRLVLLKYYTTMYHIEAPATLDGGDVLETDNCIYIGRSQRTTYEGISQCQRIFKKYQEDCSGIDFPQFLHLKSGVSYLGNNTVLVAPSFKNLEAFKAYKKIVTPPEEAYAANAVMVNGQVLIAAGYPGTRYKLQAAGYNCIELEMSEFQKKDGGLSCLSLRM